MTARPVVKERIYLDKSSPDVMHNDITTYDHALTEPWTVNKRYLRVQEKNVIYYENECSENNQHVVIGKEGYYLSGRRLSHAGQEGSEAAGPALLQGDPEIGHVLSRAAWSMPGWANAIAGGGRGGSGGRGGAAGNVGARAAAQALPDGTTIRQGAQSLAANVTMGGDPVPNFDPRRDFEPVIATAQDVLMVPPQEPGHGLREWIDYARARPGEAQTMRRSAPVRADNRPQARACALYVRGAGG